MNKVILCGRLVKDPETGYTAQNKNWTKITIACPREFNKEETDFLDCVAFGNTATFISKYFTKGEKILLNGAIQIRSYKDKNGNNRKATTIQIENVEKLESKANQNNNATCEEESSGEEISDDDLPF